ncbi:hypothetical protein JTE90_011540 [Oedothorax gibbosus]|uniref:Uncharacterized protein n=1 Tax=Oedothorax gibbosus TaxID=931172 RepID=A0AAV6UI38_9ARAC|nr:hypothetical protein JTE90_011540 [Oedothorax gibbosus]
MEEADRKSATSKASFKLSVHAALFFTPLESEREKTAKEEDLSHRVLSKKEINKGSLRLARNRFQLSNVCLKNFAFLCSG